MNTLASNAFIIGLSVGAIAAFVVIVILIALAVRGNAADRASAAEIQRRTVAHLKERNDIGREQVVYLRRIAKALEAALFKATVRLEEPGDKKEGV